MKLEEKLNRLEELADKVGVKVRYESLDNSPGGVCRIDDELHLMINKDLSDKRKIDIFVDCLRNFPLDQHYMRPNIRKLFDKSES